MTNIIFSSSLNYLFYIHRIKKTHLFIALFIINIFTIFITIAHAVWVGAVFFNKAFYIDDAIKINLVQSIYSIVVTIIFDSVLCIVLCALIKSRVILLFVNLAIIMVCLLLGSLLIDFDHITSNEPFYYLVLICPQGYLTQMNEMAFSSTTYYYINGLPSLNGSIFNPFDDYYVNYLYPYVIELKYHAWHI
ncbi:MAG: hypothetical protein LBE13_00295 [Bacteroidales bacterium]|nr:hypothetical protein [Bacteroidales bacterium]